MISASKQIAGADSVLMNARAAPDGIAAISVGSDRQCEGILRTAEAFLLDFDGDLYGQTRRVSLGHRLRGVEGFDSAGGLVRQMAVDVARELVTPWH